MNRAPQQADPWFQQHKTTCGGVFTKISEPSVPKKNVVKGKKVPPSDVKQESYSKANPRQITLDVPRSNKEKNKSTNFIPSSKGIRLGSASDYCCNSKDSPKPSSIHQEIIDLTFDDD